MRQEEWTPGGFERWEEHYPRTPYTPPPTALDLSEDFARHWQTPSDPWPRTMNVLLVAGLFSEWLPGCFSGARRAFEVAGYPLRRAQIRSGLGVLAQSRMIAEELDRDLPPGQHFIALAHSKGALDLLAALATTPQLAERCAGAVLMQPPVGPSWVLDQILGQLPPEIAPAPGLTDRVAGALMRTRLVAGGVRDISRARDPRVATLLQQWPPGIALIHAVSWSIQPTIGIDSFHARLNALRPGVAHDGQIYLDEQVLQGVPQVGLPRLDHAQPVLGGLGLDSGRMWRALAAVLFEHAQTK